MGVDIGAASRAISSLAPAGFIRSDRAAATTPEGEQPGQLIRREKPPEIRVGFGENTLSPSGAALRTLDRNLEAAGQLVPTVEELRARAREAQALREAAQETAEPVEFRQPERVRPEPSPAARNFVQDEARPVATEPTRSEATETPAEERPPVEFGAPTGARLNLQA